MKNHHRPLFLPARRVLLASAVAMLTGTLPLLAQSGSTNQTKPSSSGTYQSKSAADVDSTTESNAQNARTASSHEKLSWGDRRFVTKAADGGQDEVQLAQLAAQRATNPDVRSFAQKLVDDHSKVNSELMSLAAQKSVKVDMDNDKDRAYKRLNKKSGAEFDQEFVEHMIDEHEKAIKLFEKASTDAKDSELRSFAASHVAHLREHLQEAQSLRQTVMPTGRVDNTSGRSTPGVSPTTRGTSTTTPTREPTPVPTP